MSTPQTGPEELARRVGFEPFNEFTTEQQKSIEAYVKKWYDKAPKHKILFSLDEYWWKESSIGDNNWISYDVSPALRIQAPHLKGNY
jgi:hypothetical protein